MSGAEDNAAIVAAMVREFDFPRYAAALFAPAGERRALLALAAFDLEMIRVPDQVSQPLPGEVRLQWWSDALEGTEHGGIAGHPVASEMLWAIAHFKLPRQPLLGLIDSHKFDLYDDVMPSRAALEVYCDDTCGAWLGAGANVMSGETPAADELRDAGRAFGLVRLLTRLPHDAAHKRCFLPADDLARHGATHHQLLAGEDGEALRAARRDLIGLARGYVDRARRRMRAMPRKVRPAWLPLATLPRELDGLAHLPTFALVPPPTRLRVLSSQWWAMRG